MNSIQIENGVKHIYSNDKVLSRIIDIAGPCEIRKRKNYYHTLLGSIIGQQLSVNAAGSIRQRFFNHFDNKPLPEKIIGAKPETLRNLGLSFAKIKYVKDLSDKMIKGEIHFRGIDKLSDYEIINDFTRVKGIGVWTMHMFLIFTLGRQNILPVGDLGIRKAAKLNYNLRKLPTEKRLFQLSRKNGWEPYNSIAAWYLWKSIDMNIVI